jgi:hypothetical protein
METRRDKHMKRSTKVIIGVVIAAVLVCALALTYKFFGPSAKAGSKAYTLEVVDDNGKTTTYEGSTDAAYLKEVMDELAENEDFSYEGTDSDYGIMINTINGVTADYNENNAYWAIYVNGEYGQYGADTQPVSDGDEFQFVYESAE